MEETNSLSLSLFFSALLLFPRPHAPPLSSLFIPKSCWPKALFLPSPPLEKTFGRPIYPSPGSPAASGERQVEPPPDGRKRRRRERGGEGSRRSRSRARLRESSVGSRGCLLGRWVRPARVGRESHRWLDNLAERVGPVTLAVVVAAAAYVPPTLSPPTAIGGGARRSKGKDTGSASFFHRRRRRRRLVRLRRKILLLLRPHFFTGWA